MSMPLFLLPSTALKQQDAAFEAIGFTRQVERELAASGEHDRVETRLEARAMSKVWLIHHLACDAGEHDIEQLAVEAIGLLSRAEQHDQAERQCVERALAVIEPLLACWRTLSGWVEQVRGWATDVAMAGKQRGGRPRRAAQLSYLDGDSDAA